MFAQDYPGATELVPPNVLLPFHLDSTQGMACTDDLTHDWGPMHLCWNDGKMDSWVKVHTSSKYEGAHGAMTMGYYTRGDLPFYYALADGFTLCDAYHSSILGPTHPNRLMANSGTIDPAGTQGGPVTDTNATPDFVWNCTWTTMQELLEDAGVSWKVYSPSNAGVTGKYASLTQYPTWSPALYNPIANPEIMGASDHVLPYFTAFRNPLSPLYQKAFTPTFPNDFVLVSERFAVDVPNVSAWRQATVGDLTSTMFQSPANTTVPKLPATSVMMPLTGTCSEASQDTESGGAAPSVPTKQTMPTQGGGSQPASDYYPGTSEQASGVPDDHRTRVGVAGSALATTKSAYNRLTEGPRVR